MKYFKLIVYTFLFILIFITSYLFYTSNFTINVQEHNLKYVEKQSTLYGLKIIYIADTLYSNRTTNKDINQLVELVNKSKPNIVIFNGDLIYTNVSKNNENKIITGLKKIKADTYKLAVIGNHKTQSQNILNSAGFKVLNNELINVYYKSNEAISFYGYADDINKDLLNERNDKLFVISNKQDKFDQIIKHKPKLILSANMHHFNINIPFTNLYQTNIPDFDIGYTSINKVDIYISGGIGSSNNFRFNNPPEIYLFRLIN